MEKPILYCDCDGVILNTIEIAFNMMKEIGYDTKDANQRNEFFRHIINWIDVFNQTEAINNSINKIKLLKESNLFSNVAILTKLSGGYDEERLKRELFGDCLPNIKVITLQVGLEKASVVKAENNILIDDEQKNCDNWKRHDGTAILFKEDERDLRHDVVDDLMDIPKTKGVKKLLKARNF